MTAPTFTAHPFRLPVQDVADQLATNTDTGLTAAEAQHRHSVYGPNELAVQGPTPWYAILAKQFCNAMMLVLFIVLGVSFGVGDHVEGGVVAGVIVINVSIGFYQESRAEKKMDALRSLSSPSATVVRDGRSHVVPNTNVVPGDIVMLRTGDTVPADVRLCEAVNLGCDEQMMTGESVPVDKVTHVIEATTADGTITDADRINLAFASTTVSKGRGRGIVVATGMSTAVGQIAEAASGRKKKRGERSMNVRKYGPRKAAAAGAARRLGDLLFQLIGLGPDVTPLQRRLTYLAFALFALAVAVALVVFGVHKFTLSSEVVLYATSTGIALIPESLALVLIMTMVQATRTMRRAHVVVRDLAAVETLGGVTSICSDKTGTLTRGAMLVKAAWLPGLPGRPGRPGGHEHKTVTKVLTLRGSADPSDPTAGTVVEESQPVRSTEGRSLQRQTQVQIQVPPQHLGESGSPDSAPPAQLTPALRKFLTACALCNAASVRQDPASGAWHIMGEPTEIALQVFAQRFGLGKRALESAGWVQQRQRAEYPFDSTVKRMSVVFDVPADGGVSGVSHNGQSSVVLTKGAVEPILERCSSVNTSGGSDSDDEKGESGESGESIVPMTAALHEQILAQMNTFAPLGLRVLAVAYRPWQVEKTALEEERPLVERDLVFLGLVGIYDPPRDDTAPAIRVCADAGITVHMLTGDHPATAEAIAREVGILGGYPPKNNSPGAPPLVLPATTFDALSDADLDALPHLPLVVARCTPATKTRMINALRRRRAFMAMTGDGVNDAPSLRAADVGIAMGSGSDVAKAAAALVLADDRFGAIVDAVREGRRMYDNIQKFMLHLLVSNIAEVILLVIGLAFRDDTGEGGGVSVFPLSALHILWINIFTSALPALGLGMEAASPDVMRRPPHGGGGRRGGIFTAELVADMLLYGVVMGAVSLLTFVVVVYGANNGSLGHDCNRAWSDSCRAVFRARATVFLQLTYLILVSAWEFKDMRRSLLCLDPSNRRRRRFPLNVATDLWSNKLLFWAVVLGMLPPIVLVHVPVIGEKVLKHQPISWEWSLVFAGILVFLLAVEGWKYAKRTLGLFSVGVAGGDDGGPMQKSLSMSTMQSAGSVV